MGSINSHSIKPENKDESNEYPTTLMNKYFDDSFDNYYQQRNNNIEEMENSFISYIKRKELNIDNEDNKNNNNFPLL